MINVLLLNNTEHYHNGCKQVIQFFKNQFINENLIIQDKKNKLLPDYKNFDLIILNGEGSIHHNSAKMIKYLNYMKTASLNGVVTMVVNAVWFKNSKETTEILNYIDYVSVREIKSKNEILKFIKKDIDIHLDLSYFTEISKSNSVEKYNIVIGNKFIPGKIREKFISIASDSSIDIFSESWNDIVNKLQNTNILITGLHHEMYAACKAECKFIVIDGNTHKNSGLLETFNSHIPVLPISSSNEEIIDIIEKINNYRSDFDVFFKQLKKSKEPNYIKEYFKRVKK